MGLEVPILLLPPTLVEPNVLLTFYPLPRAAHQPRFQVPMGQLPPFALLGRCSQLGPVQMCSLCELHKCRRN